MATSILIFLTAFPLLASAQECVPTPASESPIGTCDGCDEQYFIAKDCRVGFRCPSAGESAGCLLECDVDESVGLNRNSGFFECIPRDGLTAGCPGDFQVDCDTGDGGDVGDGDFADGDVDCACADERWMNADCSSAFLCDGRGAVNCPAGQVVSGLVLGEDVRCVDAAEASSCTGAYHMGCFESLERVGYCDQEDYIENPLGTCQCEGQYFKDAECRQGFYCMDVGANRGCSKTCQDGEVLLNYYRSPEDFDYWECFPESESGEDCTGVVTQRCADDPITVDAVECGCPSEILIDGDCSQAYYCQSSINGGGLTDCGAAGQVRVDLDTWRPVCGEGENPYCPSGSGGLRMGCDGGSPTPDQNAYLCSPLMNNPIGECQCNNQIFITADCRRGFFCDDTIFGSSYEGCMIECGADEHVSYDTADGVTWGCYDRAADYVCQGDLVFDCAAAGDPFAVDCGCAGEYWESADCKQGFLCSGENTNGQNPGAEIACPNANEIIVNFYAKNGEYDCVDESEAVCAGSFHYGCVDYDGANVRRTSGSLILASISTFAFVYLNV